MKKILFFLFVFPLITLGQQKTYVPDDNFEQALIDLGLDNQIDDSVFTSNIASIESLSVANKYINNLVGIEDFNSLKYLNCSYNDIWFLFLNQNPQLSYLKCYNNDIDTLNLLNNYELQTLECNNNLIEYLDLTNNYNLLNVYAYENKLKYVNIQNGNNLILNNFMTSSNDNLDCILVDNVNFFNQYFSSTPPQWANWYAEIDPGTIYSESCNSTKINEYNKNSELSKIVNILGVESNLLKNTILIYKYEDGTVHKKLILE